MRGLRFVRCDSHGTAYSRREMLPTDGAFHVSRARSTRWAASQVSAWSRLAKVIGAVTRPIPGAM